VFLPTFIPTFSKYAVLHPLKIVLTPLAAALAHSVWSGRLQTMNLDPEVGLVTNERFALLRRTIDCTGAASQVQDELRIYESKWHSTHFQSIPITNQTTCRRIMFAPDDTKLPLGECVMKLESGCESVVFSLKGNLLKMLQHT
jgi:hypothetical protein